MTETMKRIDLSGDLDQGGSLDDLAITGDHIKMLRIERMSDGSCWGRIYTNDGPDIVLGWSAQKNKLRMDARND